MVIVNLKIAQELLEMFGGEDAEIVLTSDERGVFAHFSEYPEEGSVLLGDNE